MAVCQAIRQTIFLGGISLLPVLIQRIRDLRQPRPVFDPFQQFRRGKELDAVRRRTAAGGTRVAARVQRRCKGTARQENNDKVGAQQQGSASCLLETRPDENSVAGGLRTTGGIMNSTWRKNPCPMHEHFSD
jgi:hypothetical protein